ncbi:MAG: hypothetical protein U9P00_04125 [Pseudomonadota bacterium]|nr:hypothetical protein [Pseudomonadota bacterium]
MSHRKRQFLLLLLGILLVTGCDATPGTDTDVDSASEPQAARFPGANLPRSCLWERRLAAIRAGDALPQ